MSDIGTGQLENASNTGRKSIKITQPVLQA